MSLARVCYGYRDAEEADAPKLVPVGVTVSSSKGVGVKFVGSCVAGSIGFALAIARVTREAPTFVCDVCDAHPKQANASPMRSKLANFRLNMYVLFAAERLLTKTL